jgi:hypothetical protein
MARANFPYSPRKEGAAMQVIVTARGLFIQGSSKELLQQLELFSSRYLTLGELLWHEQGAAPRQ